MFTTGFRDQVLNTMRGTTLTAWTPYAGLLTAISSFRTPTVTEANYTGYGTRPSITFGAPAAMSPNVGEYVSNSGTVTFPQNTGSLQSMIGFGVYDAATAGNLKAVGLLSPDAPIFGTGNDGDDTITAPAHGLVTDQRVFVLGTPGCTIPAGLSEGTAYWVRSGYTTDTFTLSSTQGGAAVNITAKGEALFISYVAVDVAANATPEFAAGALVVQL